MLARLQQIITIGAALLATAWFVACWLGEHPAWALAGVVAVLLVHAVVLGVEFIALGWLHNDDPAPIPGRLLLAAWWQEVWSASRAFCWRQPFRSRAWPDSLPAGSGGARGVLLVHGFMCNRGLWNPWLKRLTRQGVPFVAVNLEPVLGSIDDYRDIIEAAVRSLERCTGRSPVIVAHSMGGLAVRRWCVEQRGRHDAVTCSPSQPFRLTGGENHAGPGQDATDCRRIHHVVTIATPHGGTRLAQFGLASNTRQMRRHSTWLAQLSAQEPSDIGQHYTCFYSHCDNIVAPPSSATLAGADNRHLIGSPHVGMIERSEPWVELQRLLTN